MNHLIAEQSQLDALAPILTQLHDHSATVSVDTEFLREKTYNAKLCLVQLGIGGDQYCIDVLAIKDLQLLVNLFLQHQWDRRIEMSLHSQGAHSKMLHRMTQGSTGLALMQRVHRGPHETEVKQMQCQG